MLQTLAQRVMAITPEKVLARVLSTPLTKGGNPPRFRIGKIWCRFDPDRHELVDESGTQVSAGFEMASIAEVDWGVDPSALPPMHSNLEQNVAAQGGGYQSRPQEAPGQPQSQPQQTTRRQ